jgi:hypothetical protein
MRLFPQRKLAWARVMLGAAIVVAGSILLITSQKSDFERLYDQIKVGIPIQDLMNVMGQERLASVGVWYDQGEQEPAGHHFDWVNDGEQISIRFKGGSVAEKNFTPLGARGQLRRLWVHTLKSAPPF